LLSSPSPSPSPSPLTPAVSTTGAVVPYERRRRNSISMGENVVAAKLINGYASARANKSKSLTSALAKATTGREGEKLTFENIRRDIKKWKEGSYAGQVFDNCMIFLSCVSCFLFIAETYLRGIEYEGIFDIITNTEMALASLFMLDWAFSLYLADQKLHFVWSFFSIIDLVSSFPIWFTYNREIPVHIRSAQDFFICLLFGLGTFRILRILRIRSKLWILRDDIVVRFLYEVSLVITVMELFFSAVMQFVEGSAQPLPFHEWMYFTWISITTVGYGDISPNTVTGQFLTMGMIGFAIVLIPKMTNELLDMMKLQSVYSRAVYVPRSDSSKHIVVTGDLSSTSLSDFFIELFHEDHENADLSGIGV